MNAIWIILCCFQVAMVLAEPGMKTAAGGASAIELDNEDVQLYLKEALDEINANKTESTYT